MPSATQAAARKASEIIRSSTRPTGMINVPSNNPVDVKNLRTKVGEPPRRIQRSEIQPDVMEAAAMTKNADEPSTAISFSEKLRWFTRYEGSHVSRKYHR